MNLYYEDLVRATTCWGECDLIPAPAPFTHNQTSCKIKERTFTMKKTLKAVLAALLVICLLLPLAACGNNATTETKLKIAIPNDTTNEARALLLLRSRLHQAEDGAGLNRYRSGTSENPRNYVQ